MKSTPPPRIWAHRGAAAEAPENTLVSYVRALERGARLLECDVHLTRDGVLVVAHDADLKRTSGVEGKISELTLDEIKQRDVGAWKSPAFAGTRVPTLVELLQLTVENKAVLAVELKVDGIEQNVLDAMHEAGAQPRDVVAFAWNPAHLAELKRLEPRLKTLYLVESAQRMKSERSALLAEAKQAGASALGVKHALIDARFIRQAHAQGLEVHAWTVDNPARMKQLAAWGIDAVISNDPALAARTLVER